MAYKKIPMEHRKKIALVAHDNKKRDLVEWAKFNRDLLAHHKVYATGTTGTMLEQELGLDITKFQSGPLGGDQQIGAKIVEGEIDFLVFFWDPLEPLPHDPDVESALAHGRGLEHSHCVQSCYSRFHDFIALDGRGISSPGAGLC